VDLNSAMAMTLQGGEGIDLRCLGKRELSMSRPLESLAIEDLHRPRYDTATCGLGRKEASALVRGGAEESLVQVVEVDGADAEFHQLHPRARKASTDAM
jgi:hypothetical protein